MPERSSQPAGEGPPVLLRLGFAPPSRPVTVRMRLRGLQVCAEGWDRGTSLAWDYLLRAGVGSARVESDVGIIFPVVELEALASLPDQVNLVPDASLEPLVSYVRSSSFPEVPATLQVTGDGGLSLSWYDEDEPRTASLSADAQAALLAANLPFVATTDGWQQLEKTVSFPPTLGRASVNMDRFVEIATSKPQVVEGAPLPALFRIDSTRFGLPLAHVGAVDETSGFRWDVRPPRSDRPPTTLGSLPLELSGHHQQDLHGLLERLVAFRSAAIVWDSGLGRRIFALAALEALDAFPLLVVTPPWGMWVWQRHLDLFGRTASLQHGRGDARLVTYRDLVARGDIDPAPYSIIFDELTSSEATRPQHREALRRLDGLVDAYRVATDRNWPEDLTAACKLADVLRPGEFRFSSPLEARYPRTTEQRAREHLDCYLIRRSAGDDSTDVTVDRFHRSQVRTVEPTDAQRRALDGLADDTRDPLARLVEALTLVSAGTTDSVSPKVTEAMRLTRQELGRGSSVAVVTFHRRSATLLRGALAGTGPLSVEADELADLEAGDRPVVVHSSGVLPPSLRRFDVVVVLDYPWSTEQLEVACGSSSADNGPSRVVLLHAVGTVDDRLAMYAARRREMAAVVEMAATPDAQAAAWLLAPRN